MSSPTGASDGAQHTHSMLRHASSGHHAQQQQNGSAAGDTGSVRSPSASSSTSPVAHNNGSGSFVDPHYRERSFPSSSSRPFSNGGGGAHFYPTSPSVPGSAPMSRAPSLSSLDISANIGEGYLLSIKCPSLVRDSALIRFHPETTVLQIKQSIERTWPGRPTAQGLRFIRGGRLLDDNETVGGFAIGADPNEPVSVHLVIRPDAWLDPKNRPTPSRRSSYLRQVPLASPLVTPGLRDFSSSSYFSTLPTQSPFQSQRTSPKSIPATLPEDSPLPSSSWPQSRIREGADRSGRSSFSYNSGGGAPSADDSSTPTERDPWMGTGDGPANMYGSGGGSWWGNVAADFALPTKLALDGDDRFREVFMATAPSNYPLLVESATLLHDVYFEQYSRLYKESQHGQRNSIVVCEGKEHSDDSDAEDSEYEDDEDALALARTVEDEMFGWDPIEIPPHDVKRKSPEHGELQYMYHEVQCNGLPYLLQLAVDLSDQQRSAALSQLLSRMARLSSIVKSLHSLSIHASIMSRGSVATSPFLAGGGLFQAGVAPGDADPPQARPETTAQQAAAAVPAAPRRHNAFLSAARSTLAGLAELSWNEIFSMAVPLFFLGLKLGIMLYVFGRGASQYKRYAMMAAATIYVVWEALKMVKRRTAMRLAGRVRQQAAARNDANGGAGDGPARPAGANVPRAAGGDDADAAQSDEDVFAPLPPVHAPRRYSTTNPSLYNIEHWLERIAYIGMDSEDEQLGLLAPPDANAAGAATRAAPAQPRRRGKVFHYAVVPLVLFFATMVPDIELRRRRAIEEREDTVRAAVRRKEERAEKVRQHLAEQRRRQQAEGDGAAEGGEEEWAQSSAVESGDAKVLREYSDRILTRRRGGAATAAALDGQDADAIRAALREDQEQQDDGGAGGDLDLF